MWGFCGSGCESTLCQHVMPFSLYCSVLVRSSDKDGITRKLHPGLQGTSSPSRSTRTVGDSIVGEGLDIIGLPSERECRRTRTWELLRFAPADVVREMSNVDHLLFSQLPSRIVFSHGCPYPITDPNVLCHVLSVFQFEFLRRQSSSLSASSNSNFESRFELELAWPVKSSSPCLGPGPPGLEPLSFPTGDPDVLAAQPILV